MAGGEFATKKRCHGMMKKVETNLDCKRSLFIAE
jgi:hypothetical protein